MAVTLRNGASLTRRRFLATAASSAAITAVGGIAKPYLSRADDRPVITHGIQSGDVSTDSGVVWARADRPVAHAGRGRDHRQLQEYPQRRLRRCAAGDRLHRQGADRGPAGRAGHVLSHPVPGSFVSDGAERAAGRALSHRAERPPLDLVRLVGRYRGLGHRRGARRHAHLRDHGEMPAGFLHPFRRPHLCRLPDPRGAEASERRDLEEHRHRGEIQGGADARGLSRQLQIQPARPEPARVQCRCADVRAMGRSRGHQ